MKLIIHITRHITNLDEGNLLYQQILHQFASDPLVHINAVADHNFKNPEPPDPDQKSNPLSPQNIEKGPTSPCPHQPS